MQAKPWTEKVAVAVPSPGNDKFAVEFRLPVVPTRQDPRRGPL